MGVAKIENLVLLVRSTIGASATVFGLLAAGLRTNLSFFGLGTIGWEGAWATPVGSFMASRVDIIGENMVEPYNWIG